MCRLAACGPTNGESFQNFARRVSEFIPTLTDCRHLDHLLIVGHQGVLSLLTALLLQMPAAAMWHFPIAHGAGASSKSATISPPCGY
nr:Alpha-ribazole phosphatase [Klebsiella pneumoniae]